MIIDNDDVDEVVTDHTTGPRSLKINSWLRLRPAVGKSQSLGIITIGIIITMILIIIAIFIIPNVFT